MAILAEGKEVGRLLNKRWLLVLAYVALIFFLSSQPGLKVPGNILFKDKLAHILEYSGLSLLMHGAVRESWPQLSPARRVALGVAIIAVLALGDELFQYYVPDRDSSPFDWMADMIGASLAQAWRYTRELRREVA